jgi:hypothetical protein
MLRRWSSSSRLVGRLPGGLRGAEYRAKNRGLRFGEAHAGGGVEASCFGAVTVGIAETPQDRDPGFERRRIKLDWDNRVMRI